MTFTSLSFVFFVIACLCLYWCCPTKFRWFVLLAASLYFDWRLSGWYLLHAVIVTAVVYCGALLVDRNNHLTKLKKSEADDSEYKREKNKNNANNKIITVFVILLSMLSWAFLKFVPQMDLSAQSELNIKWILPAGASFYTLSLVAYMVDVFHKKHPPERNFGKLLLYTAYFPCIIQGPINRYEKLGSQFTASSFDYNSFICGFERVVWGYFKKMVLADRLYQFVKMAFPGGEFSGAQLLLAAILAKIQLYGDFSGGIDIARGISEMFGIHLPINFDYPLFSKSVSEYWRRWHITLGNWMRDYMFYPLSLSKPMNNLGKAIRKKNKTVAKIAPGIVSMAVLWAFSALWHGNRTNFVLWGLYYWLIVSFDTIFEKRINSFIKNKGRPLVLAQMLITFLLVSVGEMISLSNGWSDAVTNIGRLFTHGAKTVFSFRSNGFDGKDWIIVILASIIVVIVDALSCFLFNKRMAEKLAETQLLVRWAILITGILVILIFGYYGAGYDPTPFVYFSF